MGNICARRRVDPVITVVTDNEPWLIITPVQIQHKPNRFQRVVKKVIKLLKLRKIWARSGNWLNLYKAELPRNAHIRRTMTEIFTSWPRTVLCNTKPVFDHLKRERGVLQYK